MTTVIRIENISKLYRLGMVGTGTLAHDLNRWWASLRGREDPYSKIGQVNDRTKQADGDYVWALKDIDLEVKQGEVVGIIGKNGAGKSTLLKLISRITSPTRGTIRAKGRIASLLEVGTGMHPEMTARENIFLNGAILGMRRREIAAKFDDIVDFAGCAMYVDTPLKRYSSGMKVRLGFAVAAFLEPEILIVDEVLAVGDADFQKRAIGKMKDVSSGGGRTILFVSHNMAAVTALCPETVLLENGSVTARGVSSQIVQQYLSFFTPPDNWTDHEPLEIESKYVSIRFAGPQFRETERRFFFHDEEIALQFSVESLRDVQRFTLAVWLIAEFGQVLFLTASHPQIDGLPYGVTTFLCTIPANTLSKGMYQIRVGAAIHKVDWLVRPFDAFAITVNFGPSYAYDIELPASVAGYFYPLVRWRSRTHIEESK